MTTEIAEPAPLKIDQPQKVGYCIPSWLRDEQIKYALTRIAGRLQPPDGLIDEPIACVSFGPSLNDTWEKLRDFKHIITCSGAHKFLADRSITPTYHLDVDPREHKINLIGQPQTGTQYLMASCCHPKMWEHLAGYDVKLWHIFDASDEGMRQLPPGEWAITGGCSAGLRTLTLARFLGFRDLHIFGMDGSSGPSGKHAAEHPNQPKKEQPCEFGGKTYQTTPAMLEAARTTFHELDMMPDVVPTFYGEGLVQSMAKDWTRKTKDRAIISYAKPELISAHYRQMNAQLHQTNLAYGVGGGKHAETVKKLYKIIQKTTEFVSVLDYGAGKGYLAKALPFPIDEYDPCVPGKETIPRSADLVVCTDVLEHIEPEHLIAVLEDLKRCVKQIGYFVIHLGPASKTLPDGRNTHLIQRDVSWWKHKLERRFKVDTLQQAKNELHAIVSPKKKKP